MEQVYEFPNRVTQYDDGAYRWTYDRGKQGGRAPVIMYWRCFRLLALLLSIFFLPAGIFLSAVISDTFEWTILLRIALFTCGISALGSLLLYKMIYLKKVHRYKLNREGVWFLSLQSGENSARNKTPGLPFGFVKRVEFMPQYNMVVLQKLGDPLFVPPEDYQVIREFILANINRQTNVVG